MNWNIPSDNTGGADTLGSLGNQELALALDGSVDIVTLGGLVGQVIVGNVVDAVLGQELGVDNPGAVGNDLINPLAVPDGLRTLGAAEDRQALAQMCLVIAGDTDNQLSIWEGILGLLELSHMTIVGKVVISIRVLLKQSTLGSPHTALNS